MSAAFGFLPPAAPSSPSRSLSKCLHLPPVCANGSRHARARTGVVGLGYVGLPLAVEFARNGFTRPASTSMRARSTRSMAGTLVHPRCADRGRRGARATRAARSDHRFHGRRRARHDQHLRADAAAQDQRPRHVVHRLGGRGDRQASAPGQLVCSSRRPIPGRPRKWCGRCSKRAVSRPARTSSSPSRPNASIRATRPSIRTTYRRSSAG